jgi:hypothetical protein
MTYILRISFVLLLNFLAYGPEAWGFEDTKVMPKGIRRLSLRYISTDISQKTDNSGAALELEKPLTKQLTFKDILKGEGDPLKRELTHGFLIYEGFSEEQSVGGFTADLRGRVNVYAPIFTYGLSDKVTLAMAMPIYDMSMAVNMGFKSNETGQKFLDSLANSYNNNVSSSVEAGGKINNAVSKLNEKLATNGYKPLNYWSDKGPGDLQLIAKSLVYNNDPLRTSVMGGVVAPTGRIDDPNNLIDKGFGDGQWDILGGVTADFSLGSLATVSPFAKYTYQLPGSKKVRMATDEEAIEVESKTVNFKLGDKVESGISVQSESESGFGGGVGMNWSNKYRDYYNAPSQSKVKLERDTNESQSFLEAEVYYSGVKAYKRGELIVPFETKLNYKRQLASKNAPVTHFVQLETGVFF